MAICRDTELALNDINCEYFTKVQEIEDETIKAIVGNLGLESHIKNRVIELLGARLLESRTGQVSLHHSENSLVKSVEIKFTYDK